MPKYKIKHDGFINSLPGNCQWSVLRAIISSTKNRFTVADIERYAPVFGNDIARNQLRRLYLKGLIQRVPGPSAIYELTPYGREVYRRLYALHDLWRQEQYKKSLEREAG